MILSNLEANYCNLLIFIGFVLACTVCKIFHAMCATFTLDIFLNSSSETTLNIAFIALLAIKASCFFLGISQLSHKCGRFFLTNFHRQPNFLIQRFQEGFHPHFLVSIVIPIKVGRDHQ